MASRRECGAKDQRPETPLFRPRQTGRRRSPARRLLSPACWETWTGPNGEELDTAAIITTTANRTLVRAPRPHAGVPFAPDAFDMWLDCAMSKPTSAAALIRPADDNLLEAYPVSTAVNRAANDSEILIAPAAGGTRRAGRGDAGHRFVRPRDSKSKAEESQGAGRSSIAVLNRQEA